MSKNTKHTIKMRKNFRKCVLQTNGNYVESQNGTLVKDTYSVGDKTAVHFWHNSNASRDAIKYKKSDLNRLSRQLGIEKEWNEYKNENTIYMHGLIGDLMK